MPTAIAQDSCSWTLNDCLGHTWYPALDGTPAVISGQEWVRLWYTNDHDVQHASSKVLQLAAFHSCGAEAEITHSCQVR